MPGFGEKYKRKRLLRRFRFRWKDNIKINLTVVGPDVLSGFIGL
jgi:hypothetical protein